jgi:CheY-like chemotaxis protein
MTMAHILSADDETTFSMATADLLRLRGYECHCVTNADEVLASLTWQPSPRSLPTIGGRSRRGLTVAWSSRSRASGDAAHPLA